MYRKQLSSAMPTHSTQGPAPSPAAFFLCPVVCLPAAADGNRLQQQALYEWAYQQAREVMRPSILERDLLAVWN